MGSEVEVWIYDLSKGLARSMSMAFLGKQIDGIWHTAIVAYGQEYFFGGDSIECCTPGGTILGQPDSKVKLGTTEIPYEIFHEHLRELSQTSFRPHDYHILTRNCNNFSSEVAQFLTGNDIPSYITGLPDEVLNTPFGQMIRPMLESMTVNPGQGAHRVFGESEPSHRIQQQQTSQQTSQRAAPVGSENPTPSVSSSATSQGNERKTQCVTLKCAKVIKLDDICDTSKVDSQQKTFLDELIEYTYSESNSWSISPAHINVLGSVLLPSADSKERTDNIWMLYTRLLSKSDPVHVIVRAKETSYIEKLQIDNQHCLKSICNLCSTSDGYTHLLKKRRQLLEQLPSSLIGCDEDILSVLSSLMYNISVHHKLVDDLDIPYTCALVEYLNSHEQLSANNVQLMLNTLKNFMSRNQEVRMLAFTMGLDISKYSSMCDSDDSLRDICASLNKMNTK